VDLVRSMAKMLREKNDWEKNLIIRLAFVDLSN